MVLLYCLFILHWNLCRCSNFSILSTQIPDSLHPTAVAYEDRLVIINGFNGDSVYSIDISLLFETSDNFNSWQLLQTQSNMNIPFNGKEVGYDGQSSAKLNNTIYGVPRMTNGNDIVFAGEKLVKFDLTTNKYISNTLYTNEIPNEALYSCLVTVESLQKLYVIGGIGPQSYSDKLQEYDINTDSWNQLGKLKKATSVAGCAITNNQQYVYYFGGGISDTSRTDDIQKYDIIGNSWQILSDKLNVKRYGHECVLFNNNQYIYCIGGRDNNGNGLKSVEIFDVDTDTVSNIMLYMNVQRIVPVPVVYNNVLLIMGGYDSNGRNHTFIEILTIIPSSTQFPITADPTTAIPTSANPTSATPTAGSISTLSPNTPFETTTATPTTDLPTTAVPSTWQPTSLSSTTMKSTTTSDVETTIETNTGSGTSAVGAGTGSEENSTSFTTFTNLSYMVLGSVIILPILLFLIAFCVHSSESYKGSDPPAYIAIFTFFANTGDFWSDILFTFHLNSLDSHLFLFAAIFTFIPYILGIILLIIFILTVKLSKNAYAYIAIAKYLHSYDFILIGLSLIGGLFPALQLCSSKLFHIAIFSMDFRIIQLQTMQLFRFFNITLLENAPQLVIQILFAMNNTGNGLSDPVTIIAMFFSILSLLMGCIKTISNVSDNRSLEKNKLVSIRLDDWLSTDTMLGDEMDIDGAKKAHIKKNPNLLFKITFKSDDLNSHHLFTKNVLTEVLIDNLSIDITAIELFGFNLMNKHQLDCFVEISLTRLVKYQLDMSSTKFSKIKREMLEMGDNNKNEKVVSDIQKAFELKNTGKESCKMGVIYLGEIGGEKGHSAHSTLIAMESHHRVITADTVDPYQMDEDSVKINGAISNSSLVPNISGPVPPPPIGPPPKDESEDSLDQMQHQFLAQEINEQEDITTPQ